MKTKAEILDELYEDLDAALGPYLFQNNTPALQYETPHELRVVAEQKLEKALKRIAELEVKPLNIEELREKEMQHILP